MRPAYMCTWPAARKGVGWSRASALPGTHGCWGNPGLHMDMDCMCKWVGGGPGPVRVHMGGGGSTGWVLGGGYPDYYFAD